MIRFFDLFFSLVGLVITSPLLIVIYLLCWMDTGSPIFTQRRVGRFEKVFIIYKFRTMTLQARSLPTHNSDKAWVTLLGGFLRRAKLDELPQLFNVLVGEMSLVGPRPGLPDHLELTSARRKLDIFSIRPGITGPAQNDGIDMSQPEALALRDAEWHRNMTLSSYFKYLFKTFLKIII